MQLNQFVMHKCKFGHSEFYKYSIFNVILLVIYVNDIIIPGDDTEDISSLKLFLSSQFYTKYLGEFKYFWGLRCQVSKTSSYLNMTYYWDEEVRS